MGQKVRGRGQAREGGNEGKERQGWKDSRRDKEIERGIVDIMSIF